MSWNKKITKGDLAKAGYKKSRQQSEMGNPLYVKTRKTRKKHSRCTIFVEFVTKGLFHVSSCERPITSQGVSGDDSSRNLRNLRDLKDWEAYAFCP